MKDVPENELFSAYLDGELTAAEQAEVERLLAESPAARQLLEELRALSSTLQGLPQYSLDEDISPQVLRMAEREMLAGKDLPGPLPQRRRSFAQRFLTPRALIWSGLAVAAAIMLMVVDPGQDDRPGDDRLAHAPETSAPAGAAPSGEIGVGTDGDFAEGKSGLTLTDGGAEFAEEDLDLPGLARKSQPATKAGKLSGDALAKNGPYISAREPAGKTLETSVASRATDGKKLNVRYKAPGSPAPPSADPQPVPEKPGLEEIAKARKPAATPPRPGKSAPPTVAADGHRDKLANDVDVDRLSDQLSDIAGGQITVNEKLRSILKQGGGVGGGAAVNNGGHAQLAVIAQQDEFVTPVQEAVVLCDISPAALQARTFAKLLAANGIAAASTRGEGGTQNLLYTVVATPEKIEAALADLNGRTAPFLSVQVEPAPGVTRQQEWSRFNRGDRPASGLRGGQRLKDAKPDAGGTLGRANRAPRMSRDVAGKEAQRETQPVGPGASESAIAEFEDSGAERVPAKKHASSATKAPPRPDRPPLERPVPTPAEPTVPPKQPGGAPIVHGAPADEPVVPAVRPRPTKGKGGIVATEPAPAPEPKPEPISKPQDNRGSEEAGAADAVAGPPPANPPAQLGWEVNGTLRQKIAEEPPVTDVETPGEKKKGVESKTESKPGDHTTLEEGVPAEEPEQLARPFGGRRSGADRKQTGGLQLDRLEVDGQQGAPTEQAEPSQTYSIRKGAVPGRSQPQPKSESETYQNNRPIPQQALRKQQRQLAEKYRVLFVLRVVGRDIPSAAAAASIERAAEQVDAEAAEQIKARIQAAPVAPAEPAAPAAKK